MERPKKQLHKHNSIPCFIGYEDDGCVLCIRNKAISDYEAYLKETASVERIAKRIAEVQGDILIRHGVEATTIDLATEISKMICGEK